MNIIKLPTWWKSLPLLRPSPLKSTWEKRHLKRCLSASGPYCSTSYNSNSLCSYNIQAESHLAVTTAKQMVNFDERPHSRGKANFFTWVKVYVSGAPPYASEFTTFLKRQNVGLFTDRWVLRHHQTTPKGAFMVWRIDPESVEALQATDSQPYFGLGHVTLRVARAQHQPMADT